MEEAQKNRHITYSYLRAAQQRLIDLTQDPNASVRDIVRANSIFIECLNKFENAQHEYERVLPDNLLNNECTKAFDIRVRLSDFNNVIDDIIQKKSSSNPFVNASNHNVTNPFLNNSFEASSDIGSMVTGPDPANVVTNVAQRVKVNSTPFVIPWQQAQNHNQNHNQNVTQNLNFATPIQIANDPLTSTAVSNTNNVPINFHASNVNPNLTMPDPDPSLPPPNSKLDKIKLKLFYGAYEEWQSFWETFESLVHNTNLSVINKFTYLKNSVRGEAQKVINGYSITAANYEHAIKHLKKRFGRPARIIQSHILSLLGDISVKISPSNNRAKYIAALWNFYDTALVHIRSLEGLGIQGSSVEIFLCPIILSKLPEDMRVDWFKVERPPGNLSILLDFIDSYITSLSEADMVSENHVSNSNSKGVRPKNSDSVLHTSIEKTDKLQCLHCKKEHSIETCNKFLAMSVSDRIQRIRSKKACIRCLKKNHIYLSCPYSCSQCTRKHHHLLCLGSGEKQVTGEKPNATNVAGEKQNLSINAPVFESKSNSTQAALVQHGGNKVTVLQTAKTHIVHKTQSVEISILFDSGSDRTFIL